MNSTSFSSNDSNDIHNRNTSINADRGLNNVPNFYDVYPNYEDDTENRTRIENYSNFLKEKIVPVHKSR